MGYNLTLYVFQNGPGIITQVYTQSDNYDLINYVNNTGDGAPSAPAPDSIVNSLCQPGTTTRYTFRAHAFSPYAYSEKEYDSPYCGGSPPVCDISVSSFTTTNCTTDDNNNGTVNMFAISSFGGITYLLIKEGSTDGTTNTTGFFPDLTPGRYFVTARDSNSCQVQSIGEVLAFTNDFTHFKYRMQFYGINVADLWELRLIDNNNNYLKTDYPKDIVGTDIPIVIKQSDQDEDKATAIISMEVDINLLYDGVSFTTDEFTLSQERQWKVELYLNDAMYFQGWLLSDETQDLYADPTYEFNLKATDGLPSLKGNKFGDGSGGNGYSDSQIQQYGVTGWGALVKQCLDQLGYDYSTPIFLSSLQFNNTFSDNIWADIGTWSDVFYDNEGVAIDTYSALEMLLKGLKLSIIQFEGRFIFLNWNDLSYITNPLKKTEFDKAFYELSPDFDSTIRNGIFVLHPAIQSIGFDQPLLPINPEQSLNYDKAYNINARLDFTFLSLLYPNPSFEIGSVEDGLPSNFKHDGAEYGVADYKLHNVGDLAYLGSWILTGRFTYISGVRFPGPYIHFENAIVIDQFNKKANISFQYKSYPVPLTGGDLDTASSFPNTGVTFLDSNGIFWYFTNIGSTPGWNILDHVPFGGTLGGEPLITDFLAWNSYSVQTPIFPGTGIGLFDIYFYDPGYTTVGGDPGLPVSGTVLRADIDQLILTVSDANDQYSLQIGETHAVTAVTGIPQSNTKNIDLKLFTYPNNKRISGNVFSTNFYETGEVLNVWNFRLKTADPPDRLPATITRAFGRSYQKPMRIFEGDIETNYIVYYGVFTLRFYEGSVFMPYSIEFDPRNGTAHVIMIEITDEDQQAIYTYTPIFEKSARQVISN